MQDQAWRRYGSKALNNTIYSSNGEAMSCSPHPSFSLHHASFTAPVVKQSQGVIAYTDRAVRLQISTDLFFPADQRDTDAFGAQLLRAHQKQYQDNCPLFSSKMMMMMQDVLLHGLVTFCLPNGASALRGWHPRVFKHVLVQHWSPMYPAALLNSAGLRDVLEADSIGVKHDYDYTTRGRSSNDATVGALLAATGPQWLRYCGASLLLQLQTT